MSTAYLSLGSNEGDRELWFRKAIALITGRCGEIEHLSPMYQTAAWGNSEQPDFLNMVICIHTTLLPATLLAAILAIEAELGRKRSVKWGQRTIDIDILLYDQDVISTPDLTIPHPLLHERLFTLAPLAAIAPDYIHPQLHKTIKQLLAACTDKLDVQLYERTGV